MGDGLRTIHVVTKDESLLASANAAAEGLNGWGVRQVSSQEELIESPPVAGDALLLDAWLPGKNIYEFCRTLTGRTRCRTYIVVEQRNRLAEPIAHFCGATGILERPVTASALRSTLEPKSEPAPALPSEARGQGGRSIDLPEALLADITTGERDVGLVRAIVDPDTGLFNYAFLNYKLDEEFKRAQRFEEPLACVMLGFESSADEEVLRELAGIFLLASRDTDLLGRFDESSFLFLLPHTGPDGARIMANRVAAMAAERGLTDLVGDRLVLSVGISSFPHPSVTRREELYGSAREAFQSASKEGGGVVCAS